MFTSSRRWFHDLMNFAIKCLKKPSKLHLFLVLSIYFNVLFRYSTFVMRVSCLNRRRIHPSFEPTINFDIPKFPTLKQKGCKSGAGLGGDVEHELGNMPFIHRTSVGNTWQRICHCYEQSLALPSPLPLPILLICFQMIYYPLNKDAFLPEVSTRC